MMFCLSSKLFYLKYCLFFEFYGKVKSIRPLDGNITLGLFFRPTDK
jgi:hypothetical protein